MQSIWVSKISNMEYVRLHDALQKGASPFNGQEAALIEALRTVALPEDASLVFGAKVDGARIPLTLLAGDRVVLFDVCDQQPQSVLCARSDRLASYARRISLFHKPSDGKRVHCALLVTGAEKLKPYAVHICQVLPFHKLPDYLRSLKIEGESLSAEAWLAADPKDGSVILSDRIDASLERWSRFVLDGWLNDAADEMVKLHKMGYRLYVTNDYSAAKAYCAARYAEAPDALYGFITSSDAENMFPYGGLKSGSKAKRLPRPEDEGWEDRWFDPKAEDGCRTFKRAAFESTLKNKRLDFAVLGWGDDMRWTGKWKTRGAGAAFSLDIGINLDLKGYRRPKANAITGRPGIDDVLENPRLGAYYTLLTAAREGMVLFTVSDLYTDSARNALVRAGAVKMF
ncbi:MAG: hypothetical protein ACOYI3_08480 [Christensenellales bacterium]|jgi:hypothetical protein